MLFTFALVISDCLFGSKCHANADAGFRNTTHHVDTTVVALPMDGCSQNWIFKYIVGVRCLSSIHCCCDEEPRVSKRLVSRHTFIENNSNVVSVKKCRGQSPFFHLLADLHQENMDFPCRKIVAQHFTKDVPHYSHHYKKSRPWRPNHIASFFRILVSVQHKLLSAWLIDPIVDKTTIFKNIFSTVKSACLSVCNYPQSPSALFYTVYYLILKQPQFPITLFFDKKNYV